MTYEINQQVPFISFNFKTSSPRFGNLYYPWDPLDKIIKIHLEMLTFVGKVQVDSEPDVEVFNNKFVSATGEEWQLPEAGDRAYLIPKNENEAWDFNDVNFIHEMTTLEGFFNTILRGLRDFKQQSETSDSIQQRENAVKWLPSLQKHYDDMVELVAKELKLNVTAGFYKFGDRVSSVPRAYFETV